MRVVGALPHENYARRFSAYLTKLGILNSSEVSFDPATGQMSYPIWIYEEDKIGEAAVLLAEFEKNPMDRKFDAPPLNQNRFL